MEFRNSLAGVRSKRESLTVQPTVRSKRQNANVHIAKTLTVSLS